MDSKAQKGKLLNQQTGRGVKLENGIEVWYTVQEAADILKVHPDTLIRRMDRGEIPFKTVGPKSKRIPASWVHGTDQQAPGSA